MFKKILFFISFFSSFLLEAASAPVTNTLITTQAQNTIDWIEKTASDDNWDSFWTEGVPVSSMASDWATMGVLSVAPQGTGMASLMSSKAFLAALGGATGLIVAAEWGASALAIYAAFKLGKEAVDRKVCDKVCGFDFRSRHIENATMHSEDNDKYQARIARNQVLIEIASGHFSGVVKLLKEAQNADNALASSAHAFLGKNKAFPSAQIEYLISLFAGSPNHDVHIASQIAGRCLIKCPVDLSWKFTCRMIHQLKTIEDVLYLGQILSASHHNLVSLNTVKNTNLVKFLKATSGVQQKIMRAHYDYGDGGTQNLCSQHIAQEINHNNEIRDMQEKMKALIDFQHALEDKAKTKENEALTAAYDVKKCSDCHTPSSEEPAREDLAQKHAACQANISKLKTAKEASYGFSHETKAIHYFFEALRHFEYLTKLKNYQACIDVKASMIALK